MASPAPALFASLESNLVDAPYCQISDHRSYRNGDINSYIKSYMDTLKQAESGTPTYNSEVPDMVGRKARRERRTQTIAKLLHFTQTLKLCFKNRRNFL